MSKPLKILTIILTSCLVMGIIVKWNAIEDYYILSKRFEKPKERVDQWEQDLRYLKNDYLKICRSFDKEAKEKFNSEVDNIQNELDSLTDNQIIVKLIHSVALTNDAHTNVKYKFLPRAGIVMAWFEEGLFIIKASSSNYKYLGQKIIKINGLSTDEMMHAFCDFIPGSIYNKKHSLPSLLIRPDLWNGFCKKYSSDYLIVALPDSTGLEQIDTIRKEPITGTLINLYWKDKPDSIYVKNYESFDSLPLYLFSPYKAAFSQKLKNNTIYIQINSSTNKGINLNAFAKDLRIQFDADKYDNIVYDIRLNGGGSYHLTRKTERLIINEINENNGYLYLITGNQTASAAINSAASLKYYCKDNIIIVGEPIGDYLIFWAEPKIFRLPNSGLQISAPIYQHDLKDDIFIPFKTNFGNWFWELASNGLDVTIPIEVSIKDYLAYKDPVMQKIMELIENKQ